MTKKFFTSIIALLFISNVFGQKKEYKLSLNSGLFSFAGYSAHSHSTMNIRATNSAYTNSPYGSKSGLCYGLSGSIKKITKRNILLSADLGYEKLRSKILIDQVSGFDYTNFTSYLYSADGQAYLNFHFLNLYPSIGYRINLNKVALDITGGFDLAYSLKAKEKGSATTVNGVEYTSSSNRKLTYPDFRPRVQIAADYKKAGIYVGYSYGLSNYKSGYDGGRNECYARLIRFGMTYLIK